MTIYHIIVALLLLLIFMGVCFLIYLKVQKLQSALACYAINLLATAILTYSLFMTIDQYTKQASLSDLHYSRNLRSESVVISGRVTNLTRFELQRCFLELTIVDKRGSPDDIFRSQGAAPRNSASNRVNYNLEIVKSLPGNTYKNFSVQMPFPPSFINAEFYHILKCI